MTARRRYAFGDCTLDLGRGALFRAGAEVKLRPKSFAVLRVLVERHGELVSKEELLATVWGRAVVTDGAIVQCLIDVRRAIGDEAQSIVRTVPKRGYLLDVPVRELDAPEAVELSPPPPPPERAERSNPGGRIGIGVVAAAVIGVVTAVAWLLSPREGPGLEPEPAPVSVNAAEKSIAVLPFVDMSATRDQEYLSDGIADEILSLLAQDDGLRVIARTSSFAMKGRGIGTPEIGRMLGVDYVLEGSVRKSGDRLHVAAQLVNARTGTQVWSNTYDRSVLDAIEVQSEIARQVAGALDTALTARVALRRPEGESVDPKAHEAFLRAQYFFHRRAPGDIELSLRNYQQALQIDPGFGRAWAGLAGVYGVQLSTGELSPVEGVKRRAEAIQQALRFAPDSPEVLARAAFHYSEIDDPAHATEYARRALALDPNDPLALAFLANALAWNDRLEESLEIQRRLVMHDPVSAMRRENYAVSLMWAGRFDESRVQFAAAVELNPAHRESVAIDLGYMLILEGRCAEALQTVRDWPAGEDRETALALALGALGRKAEADSAMQRLVADPGAGSAVKLAEIYAYRGDAERAFRWVRAARQRFGPDPWLTSRWQWVTELRFSPFLKPLHTDARWKLLRPEMPGKPRPEILSMAYAGTRAGSRLE